MLWPWNDPIGPTDLPVFGLFSHLIPQAELEEGGAVAPKRKRQALVPDFRLKWRAEFEESAGGGGARSQSGESVLAELKVLSCCKTRYPVGVRASGSSAVNRRAEALPGEYLKKVQKVDR